MSLMLDSLPVDVDIGMKSELISDVSHPQSPVKFKFVSVQYELVVSKVSTLSQFPTLNTVLPLSSAL